MINKILDRARKEIFRACDFIRHVRGLPGMTSREIDLIKSVLLNYKGKKIRVFEWGSGNSTIYFAKYLRSLGCEYEWHAAENSGQWYASMQKRINKEGLAGNVQVYLFEFPAFWQKPDWDWKRIDPDCRKFGPQAENEKDYIDLPAKLNKEYDVVIIDARFRRRCSLKALEVVSNNGAVIMHDAEKNKYQVELKRYPHGRFFKSGRFYHPQADPNFWDPHNMIWVGSKSSEIIDQLSNIDLKSGGK